MGMLWGAVELSMARARGEEAPISGVGYVPLRSRLLASTLMDSRFWRPVMCEGGPLDGMEQVPAPWLRDGENLKFVDYVPQTAFAQAMPDDYLFEWSEVGEGGDLRRDVHLYRLVFSIDRGVYVGFQ